MRTGRAVRRWTRRRAGGRAAGSVTDLLVDVYTAAFAVVMTVAIALTAATHLGAELAAAPPTVSAGVALAPGWLAVLAALAALAGLAGLAARLGPVALSGPQARWWLPLPVDRRSLLRPAAARWPLLAVAPGALLGA
ncbi:DUF6297 family protein, partial [Georgenia thermotolerans]